MPRQQYKNEHCKDESLCYTFYIKNKPIIFELGSVPNLLASFSVPLYSVTLDSFVLSSVLFAIFDCPTD